MPIAVGDRAPDFALKGHDDKELQEIPEQRDNQQILTALSGLR